MNIVVFCASSPSSIPAHTQAAEDLGRWIGEAGHTLVYGGSNVGLMNTVSSAALAAGGQVTGIETTFFRDRGLAKSDLTHQEFVDSLAERKQRMMELGDAFVALPGGVGTLDEVTEVMCGIRAGMDYAVGKPCVLLDIDGFWQPCKSMLDAMKDAGYLPSLAAPDGLWRDKVTVAFVPSVDALARTLDSIVALANSD